MQWEILERIRQQYHTLTKRQRQAADWIAQDFQRLAFASAATIAVEAGVSEATVIRLATALGYGGYAEMQTAVRTQANARLEGLGLTRRQSLLGDFQQQEDILTGVARRHQDQWKATLGSVDRAAFRAAAHAIAEADQTLVIAHHWSRSLGYMLTDLLRSVTFQAQMAGGQEEREWQIASLSERAVAVAIGFPRYAGETLDLLAAARSRGARALAITDGVTSPLATQADWVLTVPGVSAVPGADYFAGAVTLVYALHVAVSLERGPEDERSGALQQVYQGLGTFR